MYARIKSEVQLFIKTVIKYTAEKKNKSINIPQKICIMLIKAKWNGLRLAIAKKIMNGYMYLNKCIDSFPFEEFRLTSSAKSLT